MADVRLSDENTIKVNLASEEPIRAEIPDVNYIPGYVVAEEQRRANELERMANEEEREAYYEDIQQRVANGEFNGKDGVDGKDGEKGEKGDPGEQGLQGIPGEKGDPGAGIIPGGLAGQYLRKLTDADYETEWADVEGGSNEGTSINFLTIATTDTFILEGKQPGLYRFSINSVKVKGTESFSSYERAEMFDSTLYIVKEYSEAEEDEIIAYLVSLAGNSTHWKKNTSSTSGISSYTTAYNDSILKRRESTQITGTYTFNTLPKTSVVPTEDTHFVNKAYVDSVASGGGDVDLSNYYTKEETDTLVSESGVDDTVLLHYRGHVDSVSSLPSTGQASGTVTDDHLTLATSMFTTPVTSSHTSYNFIMTNKGSYPYFFAKAYYMSDYGYERSTVVAGNHSNLVDGVQPQYIHINASEENPAYVRLSTSAYICYDDAPTTSSQLSASNTMYTITKPCWLQVTANGNFMGNLTTPVKFLEIPSTHTFTSGGCTSATADGFVYNDGMQMLAFNEDYSCKFITNESEAEVNDVYTVGANKDIYRCNESPAWELWSKSDVDLSNYYNKTEVDNLTAMANFTVVETNATGTPFIFAEHGAGIYFFKNSSKCNVYCKATSSSAVTSLAILDLKLNVFKAWSEATSGEVFAECIDVTGVVRLFTKTSDTAFSTATVDAKKLFVLNASSRTVSGTTTFSGNTSFSVLPTSNVTPSATNQLVTKTYVDGISLYKSTNGTTDATLTLSQAIENFTEVEILYSLSSMDSVNVETKVMKSVRVKIGNTIALDGSVIGYWTGGGYGLRNYASSCKISGTTLTKDNGYNITINTASAVGFDDTYKGVYIHEVIGYK